MSAIQQLPSRKRINQFSEELMEALVPMVAAGPDSEMPRPVQRRLEAALEEYLFMVIDNRQQAADYCNALFGELPTIAIMLRRDAEMILQFDPAAYSLEEVLATYPGFLAIAIHRIAHKLYKMQVPILPRLISESAHRQTGIDIHPGATIGCPFFIDHGTGVVIGETCMVGSNVKLYQGVTLGALNVSKEYASKKRHPTIEDNVVIYANSTILGGNTTIGAHSIIGGNTWITESILPYSVVYHKQDQVISVRKEIKDVMNWVI